MPGKTSKARCLLLFCEPSIAARLHPADRPLQNIDHGSGGAKVVRRRAAKTSLCLTRWRRPLTIVSAHVDFQLSATRQPPPSFLTHGSWGGAKNRAGSSLQQGADSACSPSLQLPGSQAASAALSRATSSHLWPAAPYAPHNRLRVKSGDD